MLKNIFIEVMKNLLSNGLCSRICFLIIGIILITQNLIAQEEHEMIIQFYYTPVQVFHFSDFSQTSISISNGSVSTIKFQLYATAEGDNWNGNLLSMPMSVLPGQTLMLNQFTQPQPFDYNQAELTGYDPGGPLPEGEVTYCVVAVSVENKMPLSNTECETSTVINMVPIYIDCHETLNLYSPDQLYQMTWNPAVVASGQNLTYEVIGKSMPSPGHDPMEVLTNPAYPVIYQQTVNYSFTTLTGNQLPVPDSSNLVFMVVAKDPEGVIYGMSEPCVSTFISSPVSLTWQMPGTTPEVIHLLSPTDGDTIKGNLIEFAYEVTTWDTLKVILGNIWDELTYPYEIIICEPLPGQTDEETMGNPPVFKVRWDSTSFVFTNPNSELHPGVKYCCQVSVTDGSSVYVESGIADFMYCPVIETGNYVHCLSEPKKCDEGKYIVKVDRGNGPEFIGITITKDLPANIIKYCVVIEIKEIANEEVTVKGKTVAEFIVTDWQICDKPKETLIDLKNQIKKKFDLLSFALPINLGPLKASLPNLQDLINNEKVQLENLKKLRNRGKDEYGFMDKYMKYLEEAIKYEKQALSNRDNAVISLNKVNSGNLTSTLQSAMNIEQGKDKAKQNDDEEIRSLLTDLYFICQLSKVVDDLNHAGKLKKDFADTFLNDCNNAKMGEGNLNTARDINEAIVGHLGAINTENKNMVDVLNGIRISLGLLVSAFEIINKIDNLKKVSEKK